MQTPLRWTFTCISSTPHEQLADIANGSWRLTNPAMKRSTPRMTLGRQRAQRTMTSQSKMAAAKQPVDVYQRMHNLLALGKT